MKKLFTFTLFFITIFYGNAQNSNYYNRMQHIFGNIDKTKVTTGYLKEFGIRFNEVEVYNGVINNNNFVDKTQWQSLYSSLYTMRVGTVAQNMVAPATIFNTLKTQQAGTSDILLATQHYTYQQYKTNAYTNGDVTISNERIYDVVGRNPYETKRIFAVTPLKHKITGNTFSFKLPSSLAYGNAGTPTQIQVDFGNGQGYQTVSYDTPIAVTYTSGGEKEIKVKFVYGSLKAVTYYSHSKIYVKYSNKAQARYDGTGVANYVKVGQPYLGTSAYGIVTVELAPGHTQLTKPLIIVEGFDPDNSFDYDDFINTDIVSPGTIDVEINLSTGLTLNQAIEDEGYDLVFINYANGTDYIQRNAYMVKEVIKWVNEQKATAGSTEQNVVLGMSMGGLVARYALRDMELNNEIHDTKLYISHDAPHQGANVPLAYQTAVRHLAGAGINLPSFIDLFVNVPSNLGNAIPDLQDGLDLLQTPAAQQMLIYQLQGTGSGVSVNNSSLYHSFATEYATMGYPQQGGIRNIAIANGSECGTPLEFNPYANLIDINAKIDVPMLIANGILPLVYGLSGDIFNMFTFALSTNTDLKAELNLKALPNKQSKQIYNGKVYVKKTVLGFINVEEHLITPKTLNSTTSMLPLDNAGGGIYDIETITDLPSELNDYVLQRKFNFIPTYSSLDISGGSQTMLYSDLTKTYSPLSPPLAPKSTPFHNFYTNPATSEKHIQFTLKNGNWLLDELQGNSALYSCVSDCADAKLPLMIYGGVEQLCDNATSSYTLLNLNPNSGATVNWSVIPAGAVSNITSNGNSVSITSSGNLNGVAVLRASISTDCGEKIIGKSIYMGAQRPRLIDGQSGQEIFHIEGYTLQYYSVVFDLPPGALEWEWRKISGNYNLMNISNNHGTIFSYQPTFGVFDVRVRDACGWSPRTMITVNITNSSGGGFEPLFTPYPNPATDILNIQESTSYSEFSAQNSNLNDSTENTSSSTLYDFNGNPVRNITPATGTIDLQGLQAGHYILVIIYGSETETHHIYIQ